MARTFYRIIKGAVPTLDDFRSHKQAGKPLRNPAMQREWAEGISVSPDLGDAKQTTRASKLKMGRFVVPLCVPEDGSVEVRQTGAPPHHTIYLTGQPAKDLVCGSAIAVEEEP